MLSILLINILINKIILNVIKLLKILYFEINSTNINV